MRRDLVTETKLTSKRSMNEENGPYLKQYEFLVPETIYK